MADRINQLNNSATMSDDELDAVFKNLMQQAAKKKKAPAANVEPKISAPAPSVIDVKRITNEIDLQECMDRTMSEWSQILASECGVYLTKYGYLAKKYHEVQYQYIGYNDTDAVNYAKHNLVAVLRYKYFRKLSDDCSNRIDDIVSWFCKNINNNICFVTIDSPNPDSDALSLQTIPNSAVAFSNGIFDFKENRWLIKYQKIKTVYTNNTIILYPKYVVFWYFNYNFEPYPFSINELTFKEFCELMLSEKATMDNLTWQLFWNMSHNATHAKDFNRMVHLSEILGYTVHSKHVQAFVMLVGLGANGKNSIYDGAFSYWVNPAPTQEDIDNIEEDKFIGGTLMGISHNIALETAPGVKKKSDQLKKLTGSTEFTSEDKGKRKTTIPMNCKFIFSTNNQQELKFSDTSMGFKRRCNLFELHYTWDPTHKFLRLNKDYYNCDFELPQMQARKTNSMLFVYLAMYGIQHATSNFTKPFTFTYNEWSELYVNKDNEIEDFFINVLTIDKLFEYWTRPNTALSDLQQRNAFCIKNPTTNVLEPLNKSDLFRSRYNQFNKPIWDIATFLAEKETFTDVNDAGDEFEYKEIRARDFVENFDVYVSSAFLAHIFNTECPIMKLEAHAFVARFRQTFNIAKTTSGPMRYSYIHLKLGRGGLQYGD